MPYLVISYLNVQILYRGKSSIFHVILSDLCAGVSSTLTLHIICTSFISFHFIVGIGQVVLQIAAMMPCKLAFGIEKSEIPSKYSEVCVRVELCS